MYQYQKPNQKKRGAGEGGGGGGAQDYTGNTKKMRWRRMEWSATVITLMYSNDILCTIQSTMLYCLNIDFYE